MDGRTHVLPRLNEFSGAVLSFFRAFSLDHATERLTRTTVQGNFFFWKVKVKTAANADLQLQHRQFAATNI